jgi:hypothetical protein
MIVSKTNKNKIACETCDLHTIVTISGTVTMATAIALTPESITELELFKKSAGVPEGQECNMVITKTGRRVFQTLSIRNDPKYIAKMVELGTYYISQIILQTKSFHFLPN